ncbi:MAG: chondroitin lyase [Chitinophagaceae bacterium]|nr:chondroitin lyase [Chitinophagaceae bacterium]
MKIYNYLFAAAFAYLPSANDALAQLNTHTKEINTAFTKLNIVKSPHNTIPENSSPDLEIIRKRIINDLLEPPVNSEDIKKLMQSIQPDGSWPNINYVDTSRTGFQHSQHLQNMLALSRAYKKPGTEFYQNPAAKKTVSSALDFWIAHDFICQNWWWNEMGTPNWMINTMLVLDEDLTEKQRTEGARIANRANLEGFGARPGGDLIQIAGMLGKQALFKRDETILERVIKTMASEIKTSTGRGLQPDMSFHHRTDNVISTLTYGTGYASSFAYWAVKIAGTKFKFPEEAIRLLIDYYIDGISKSMAFSKYPDIGAKNRDLSRKGTLEAASPELAENLLIASNYRKTELEEIVKIRKGEKKANLSWNRFFWHSEYFTHQRPNWFSSVRMHSNRQNNMEEPHNEEGLKNHHFADGSNFISLSGKEYLDIFPVWDWQKIPGATIVQKPELPHWKQLVKKGLSDFVGGVTDGMYGAAAFDFNSPHDPLKARKAWFFFDREYVCLGTGISSDEAQPVFTTLNQCQLNKDVVIMTENKKTVLGKGKHSLNNVSWILHAGVAYFFPTASSIQLSTETASGNWRQINHQASASEELVQKDVFGLWLDHGPRPRNAKYEYIVVPAIEASAMEKYNNQIIILSNTFEIQAVHHKELNRSEIVFYKEGSVKISADLIVTAVSSCMVMIKANGKRIEKITVSDPTRKLKSLQLMVSAKIESSGDHWRSKWSKEKKASVIEIDLPADGFAGQSVVLEL